MTTLEYWHVCSSCGKDLFPNADNSKMTGITVMAGDCPRCGLKDVTLIPISDFEYASGDDDKWD